MTIPCNHQVHCMYPSFPLPVSVSPMASNSTAAVRKAREPAGQGGKAVQPGPQRTQEHVRGPCRHVQVWA